VDSVRGNLSACDLPGEAAGISGGMSTVSSADVSQDFATNHVDGPAAGTLLVAVISPDEGRRTTMRKALVGTRQANVREFDSYPPEQGHLKRLLSSFDVIFLELDSNPDVALGLVEKASTSEAAKFIVYSENSDPKLAIRTMRAGAREYLLLPLEQGALDDALARTESIVHERALPSEKTLGKLFVFVGSKGGSGVTTVACNVAIALAQKFDERVLLIDLALPIGDAALCLGIAADYSTEDALRNIDRLDARYLQNLLVKHRSGVYVLAAPTNVPEVQVSKGAIDKLIAIARREYDHVIVDVGSRIDVAAKALFEDASTIYLVTQTGISELRNSNRLISQFFTEGNPNLEVVINRMEPRFSETTGEDVITKALGRPVRWKIPDDQNAARALQHGDSGAAGARISRTSLEMAGAITGRPLPKEKKKELDLKGLARSAAQTSSDKAGPASIPNLASMTSAIKWPTPNAITYGEGLTEVQLNATASVAGTFVYTPGPGYVLPVGTHTLWVTFTPAASEGGAPVQAAVSILVAKATPFIDWPTPAEIPGGTPLDETQLNASALVAGVFEYSPAAGKVLPRGTHTLSVTFTPEDSANYNTAEATVEVSVAKLTSPIEWSTPDRITYGAQLSGTQLCAKSTVPGSFEYTPGMGAVLSAGEHKLSVLFTPQDTLEYSASQAVVPLTVGRANPSIEWPIPAPIAEGTALSATQLNAKVSVPGSLVYRPALGSVLGPGVHNLGATFTPTDTLNYTKADAVVSLTVNEKQPSLITWPVPSAISYGAALSEAQLNATASVPGSFVYTPSAGHVLAPGRYTLLASFTPENTDKFTTANAMVELEVEAVSDATLQPAGTAEPLPDWRSLDVRSDRGADREQAQVEDLPEMAKTLDMAPMVAGAADAASEWSFLDPHSGSGGSAPAPARAFDAASAPAEAGDASYTWTFTSTNSSHPESAPAESKNGHHGAKKAPHETRMYKGALYEKGDDGQWHLQKK
jgi:Flp pilus assembly CpaE family ATPase